MKDWLKKAFAVPKPEEFVPTERQVAITDRVCQEVVRRHMSTPAMIFLETFRPLNYLGSQVLHFFQPIVSAVLTTDGYQVFTEFLENRGSVDYLCRRIEHFESEYTRIEQSKSAPDEAPDQSVADNANAVKKEV